VSSPASSSEQAERPDLGELAKQVAGFGLGRDGTETTVGKLAPRPLDSTGWRRILEDAAEQRLLGLMVQAVEEGALPVDTEQARELYESHAAALAGDLVHERELIRVIEVLTRAGLDHRVLKGAAVAHLDYPDPALRSFADVDLLVRPDEWDDAVRALSRAGWSRRFLEPRPGFDRRFVKGADLSRPDRDTELDLHRTFSSGPFGLTVNLPDLWSDFESLQLAGVPMRALSAEKRLLNACFNAVLGDYPPQLIPIRDVAQMISVRQLDVDRLVELAKHWRAEAVLSEAVELARTYLAYRPPVPVTERLTSLRPRKRELKTLDLYLSPGRSYAKLVFSATRAIRRPSDKVRYVLALAFPTSDYIGSRYSSRRHRWLSATRSVLGKVQRRRQRRVFGKE
jgi:hypothetical protein